MKKYLSVAFLIIWLSGFCQQITLRTLLHQMTDRESVARWPEPFYTLKQSSSYDRKSISPDKPGWFANADFNQFIREEKKQDHSEYVMMDAAGPGAVVRFWLTTVVKQGNIRFYFDNEEEPSIEVPAFDLMKAGFNLGPALLNPHSSYEPAGKGGNTLYLPLPYHKHCKITWEYADTASMKTSHYYQINYRTYPAETRVKTFTMTDLASEKNLVDQTELALWKPLETVIGKPVTFSQKIASHKQAVTNLTNGRRAIQAFSIKLSTADSANYEKAWRSVIVKIVFDGLQTVWCPLGDFVGSGYGGRPTKSWYRQLNKDGTLISRWIMPYKKTAQISFINRADFDVKIDAAVVTDVWKWDERTMYFHANYKYEENVKDVKFDYDVTKVAKSDSAGPIDWNFATIKGGGVYLGNTLAVNNHMNAWYGEGDAKAWVDRDTFPSEFGTGLEDYYNTSWAPVVLYQTPFANAPRADNPSSLGHNTFTRTRNLDGIPFNSSFKYDMEMLSWTGGFIDCAATTYWYGLPGAIEKDSERDKE